MAQKRLTDKNLHLNEFLNEPQPQIIPPKPHPKPLYITSTEKMTPSIDNKQVSFTSQFNIDDEELSDISDEETFSEDENENFCEYLEEDEHSKQFYELKAKITNLLTQPIIVPQSQKKNVKTSPPPKTIDDVQHSPEIIESSKEKIFHSSPRKKNMAVNTRHVQDINHQRTMEPREKEKEIKHEELILDEIPNDDIHLLKSKMEAQVNELDITIQQMGNSIRGRLMKIDTLTIEDIKMRSQRTTVQNDQQQDPQQIINPELSPILEKSMRPEKFENIIEYNDEEASKEKVMMEKEHIHTNILQNSDIRPHSIVNYEKVNVSRDESLLQHEEARNFEPREILNFEIDTTNTTIQETKPYNFNDGVFHVLEGISDTDSEEYIKNDQQSRENLSNLFHSFSKLEKEYERTKARLLKRSERNESSSDETSPRMDEGISKKLHSTVRSRIHIPPKIQVKPNIPRNENPNPLEYFRKALIEIDKQLL